MSENNYLNKSQIKDFVKTNPDYYFMNLSESIMPQSLFFHLIYQHFYLAQHGLELEIYGTGH